MAAQVAAPPQEPPGEALPRAGPSSLHLVAPRRHRTGGGDDVHDRHWRGRRAIDSASVGSTCGGTPVGGCRRAVDDNAGSIVTGSPSVRPGSPLATSCAICAWSCSAVAGRLAAVYVNVQPACSAAASISIGPNRRIDHGHQSNRRAAGGGRARSIVVHQDVPVHELLSRTQGDDLCLVDVQVRAL